MELSLQDRIRERAYAIWNATGCMHGQAEQHWLAAEREVLCEISAPIVTAATRNKGAPARRRRPVTNISAQSKKTAKAG
jgi:hypothetical protein